METLHRLFALDRLLRSHRYPVPTKKLLIELSCSKSTFKRLLRTLRDQYGFPIKYNHQYQGYYYDYTKKIQVPGLWFNSSELQALLSIQQLLKQLRLSLFGEYFQELTHRINILLSAMGETPDNVAKRIRMIPIAHQQITAEIFFPLSQGVLQGLVLNICYQDIQGKFSEREISPQRLVYYRDHWYLDAWCHLRQSLRVFWVAGIKSVQVRDESARCIEDDALDQQLMSSYGIFVGKASQTVHLRFTGLAAMRVRGAEWHPDQLQLTHEDGSVELWIPYSDYRELAMDIMRYGAEVEVLEPENLRNEVIKRLKMALNLYEKKYVEC